MKKTICGVLVAIGLVGCTTIPTVQRNVEITISADHAVTLNGQTVNATSLGSALTATAPSKSMPVVIRADKTVPYQVVAQVLDQVKAAGLSRVSIATK